MIARVKGTLLQKDLESVVIDVNGLGFRLVSAPRIVAKMPPVGEEVSMYTHLNVRENDLTLYGFRLEEEMNLFALLITVSGIGPKYALQILDSLEPTAFAVAVLQGDIKKLTSAKGIGKKTAERLILELKDKLAKSDLAEQAEESDYISIDESHKNIKDAMSALLVLGYSQQEVEKAIKKISPEADDDVESILRQALKHLARW